MSTSESTQDQANHCLRCGRKLTVTVGPYGRTCARKVREAALAEAREGFTPAQRDKADDLIRDGGAVEVAPGLYEMATSGELETCACDGHSCSCAAGWADKRCYHLLVARVLSIASRRTLAKAA